MTTEHIPALSGSLYCCFLAIRMCLILKYRIFFEKEKINFVNVIIGWLQSYFLWLIPIYQVNYSWKDLVYLLLKNASFGGWVIFQALPIYLVSLCQNLNLIWKSKNLSQMMKNEGSNSTFDIKKYHLKIALHFWRYLFMKNPMFLRYSLRYEGFKLVKSFPFWSYIWHYSLSCYYFLLERKNHFYKVISAGRGHFELLGIPLLDCFHSKQKVTCTRGLNLTFCFKNEILLPFLTLSYLKEYLENIGFLWANFSKNVTRFLSGIFL